MTGIAGHFGEWLQGRLGPDGPLALVTLACTVAPVEQDGTDPLMPASVIAAFCDALGVADPGIGLVARMPLGAGTGASTAALIAIARAAGVTDPDRVRAACLTAEGASDPLMLPRPDAVLWAPREGRVLREGRTPPRAQIVGGFFGPPTPTDPADIAFPDIADLADAWSAAETLDDHARIATESALRCTALRGPANDPTRLLAADLGALGHARAHTGSARALIFAPGTAPDGAEQALAQSGLAAPLQFVTGGGT